VRVLDLGCGNAKVEGAVGVDVIRLEGVDVLAALDRCPFPFQDNSFDAIYLNDIIEHLPNTLRVMEELHRILVPDGTVFIRVVNWNHRYTAMDPTHVRAFTENSFDFFGKRRERSYYTHARFDVVRVEYIFNAKVKRILRSERLMKFLSDYLCNILQGLKFELRAVKEEDE